jgi:hypothetical protein
MRKEGQPHKGWKSAARKANECVRCDGTGIVGRRNRYPYSYVGPGPVPEEARGVSEWTCDPCNGTGLNAPPEGAFEECGYPHCKCPRLGRCQAATDGKHLRGAVGSPPKGAA